MLKAYENKFKFQMKMNNILAYNLGQLIAYSFHQPNEYPNYYKFFGEETEEEQEDNSWKQMYANLVNYDLQRKEYLKRQNKVSKTS
jgi:hypothetical protein